MYCHNCGTQLKDGTRFCPNCGAAQYKAWNGSEPAQENRTDASAQQYRNPGAGRRIDPRPEQGNTMDKAASTVSSGNPHLSAKKKGGLKWVIVAIALIVVVIWAFKPDDFAGKQSKTPDSGKITNGGQSVSIQDGLQDIEDIVPDDVPIIVDEASLFTIDDVEDYDEYNRLKQKFDDELDTVIRAKKPRVCVVSVVPEFVSANNYDTLGERYGYPYFWMSSCGTSGGGRALWEGHDLRWIYYDFTYSCDDSQIAHMQNEIDAAREEYLSLIPADADAWKAAKTVHDELIRRVTYDQTKNGTHCHDIYGALVENSAVCQGYAYAFSYVMREWTMRTGRQYYPGYNYYHVVVSEDHAWNTIGEQTNDTNMDVTWDDLDMTDTNGEPYILYSYFGLTTDEIQKVDSHENVVGHNQNDSDGAMYDPQPFNYHRHEGYYFSSFDVDAIAAAFYEQYSAGSNVLTVKFENQADYDRARTWADANKQELWDILGYCGYYDRYYCWMEDELLTISIGLNAPAE